MFSDPNAPRTVLCVEDDAINVLLMCALFERRPDLHLLVASDCAQALRLARAQQPDLLLLDLYLPDGHGCALLPQLRALPGLQQVPAVAVTTEDLPNWSRYGFDALWPEPLQMSDALYQLDRWLPERPPRSSHAVPAAAGRAWASGSSAP